MDASTRQPSPLALPNPWGGLAGRVVAPVLVGIHRLLGLHEMEQAMQVVERVPNPRGPGESWGRAMRIRVETDPAPLAEVPPEGPVVFVANHPMGGPEAVGIGALVEQVRPDARFVINRVLGVFPEVAERSFLVDPFGGPDAARRSARGLRQALDHLAGGGSIAVFPAGEVAHLTWDRRSVSDPRWDPIVAKLIIRARATVVPVFFHGRNGWRFQVAGLLHPRLRTALLAREFLRARGSTVRVVVGSPIPWATIERHPDPAELIEYLRARTYLLRERAIDPARTVNLIERLRTAPAAAAPRPRPRIRPVPTQQPVPQHPTCPPARFAEEVDALPPESILMHHRDWTVAVGRRRELPKVVEEIGRLREIAFRAVGEGSGKRLDLDRFDDQYLHLFLWDRKRREVLGAYRLGPTDEILPTQGVEGLYTHTLFDYGADLMRQLGPALELGRSFVRPEYQRHPASLMLLWKGIGRFLARNPRYRMMFGPVSISNAYQSMSRRLLIAFLSAAPRLSGLGRLIRPRNPVSFSPVTDFNEAKLRRVAADLDEVDALVREIEANQRTVPVLLRQYLKLNAKLLGFNIDPDFHECLDGLMLADLLDVDRRIMNQYMGEEGAEDFLRFHAARREQTAGAPSGG